MPSRMGQRYPRDYTEERLREIADDLDKAVTVPVNVMVETDHRVYDLSEMKEILSATEKIILQDCGCKTEYSNCDSPMRVCLSLNIAAEQALEFEEYNPQEVSQYTRNPLTLSVSSDGYIFKKAFALRKDIQKHRIPGVMGRGNGGGQYPTLLLV